MAGSVRASFCSLEHLGFHALRDGNHVSIGQDVHFLTSNCKNGTSISCVLTHKRASSHPTLSHTIF